MTNIVMMVIVICFIGVNIAASVFLFILWRRTSRRMSRIIRSQHGLMSMNRNMIVGNRDGIDANKNAVERNRISIEANSSSIGVNKASIDVNKANIAANKEMIDDNRDKIAELSAEMEEFKMTVRSSMYIREANVEKSNGLWCFEHKGEKKYYKPGKIEKVERGDDVTTFDYEEDRVIARVMRKKKPIAEIVYTLQGTPVSGRICENGKTIRKFKYNELGQVV